MSDKNANDNDAPNAAKGAKGEETATPAAEAPAENIAGGEDAEADAEKSAWEKGPDAQIEALATEAADLKDKLLRNMAEMENMRRRAERDREDARKYAVTAFARDILGVGDNMNRAVQSLDDAARGSADAAVKTFIEGIEMTERELLNVFERHGIARVEPKGEKFDPNFHQAMFEVENAEVASGTVLEVVAAGYTIGDRVLRPAMVGVSKGGPKSAPKPADQGATEQQAESDSAADAQAAAKSHQDMAEQKTAKPAGKTVDKSA